MATATYPDEIMAKTPKAPPPPPEPDPKADRVTLLNLKGDEAEKNYLDSLRRKTGVALSEIARRGIAMWAIKRGLPKPPSDWIENGD